MWLMALDDLVLADVGIPPAMVTNQSSHLGFGVDRRAGVSGSVFFGASARPASWHAILQCPDEAARHAVLAVLAAPREDQVRLLARRELYGDEVLVTEGAVTSVRAHGSGDTLEVTFESNDSVWLASTMRTASKSFTSPLDQVLHLPVGGNVPTQPLLRLTPTTQREATTAAVGWRYRRRLAVSHEGDAPLFRYAVRLPLGDTAALVSGGKARSDGADLRVWLHGLEQARSLVDWNTGASYVWVVVPALPPGESLTYEIVYGNAQATAADGVDLVYPDLPAYDLSVSTNYLHRYRTARDSANAGRGLWHLSSALEGGSADYEVPGGWQPALTYENPNNTDNYVQPRAQRLSDGGDEWYQALLYAARWRGPGFPNFDAYAGSDPFDGVTLYNPFGVRAVHSAGVSWRNDAAIKTVVTTTVGDTTESSEVLVPHDPFTRVVVIGRNSGGEGWHVLEEYGATVNAGAAFRLYLPSSGAAPISPSFDSGWEYVSGADRVAAVDSKGSTAMATKSVSMGQPSGDLDGLVRQYVYPLPPGVAFSTADTVKGQIRAAESNANHNMRAQMVIRVMTSTSIVRATLLGMDTDALDDEFAVDTLTNRQFPRGGEINLEATYTTVAGDYLVIELGTRTQITSGQTSVGASLRFGDVADSDLAEDESATTDDAPWIEFSTDLAPSSEITTVATTWTPPSPVKHFGIACWPLGGVQIPEDAESRVFIESDGDTTVYVAAEPLLITEIEGETEIYELATELRLHGGSNAAGPYHTLLVGNARQAAGPGTPRASLVLGEQGLQIDTERRTHTLWDTTFTAREEALSAHAVRALAGGLREVDATDIPALERLPVTVPNGDFASDLSGWELAVDDGDWTYTVSHDDEVGGAAVGALKFAVAVADAATVLYGSTTAIPVEAGDSLEVRCWLRQSDAGAAAPRLGVEWYDGEAALLATTLDQMDGVVLPPAIDHELVCSGAAPAGAETCRVVLGVTAITDAPGTKWFDDVRATIVRPLRYDGTVARVTEETRTAQWLPLSPARRMVANGGFDADIASWAVTEAGEGLTYTVTHDAETGGEQDGALQIAITGNSGSDGVAVGHGQRFALHGLTRVEVSAWVMTSDTGLLPRLAVDWYQDADAEEPMARALEPVWSDTPEVDTGYTRAYAAIAPPEATHFRLGLVADVVTPEATGTVWFDDVRLNDNELFVHDVSAGELSVAAQVRPRWVP